MWNRALIACLLSVLFGCADSHATDEPTGRSTSAPDDGACPQWILVEYDSDPYYDRYEYDDRMKMVRHENAGATRSRTGVNYADTTFDFENGRITAERDVGEDATDGVLDYRWVYDLNRNGSIVRITNGLNEDDTDEILSYERDSEDRIVMAREQRAARGVWSHDSRCSYEYDARGRMTSEVCNWGGVSRFAWDDEDRLVLRETESPSYREQTEYVYERGLLVERIDLDGARMSSSRYDYDSAGLLIRATQSGSERTTSVIYERDAVGRLIATWAEDAPDDSTRWEYDTAGRLSRVIRENGATDITYEESAESLTVTEVYDGTLLSFRRYACSAVPAVAPPTRPSPKPRVEFPNNLARPLPYPQQH